jgi:dTDP-4-amino-4,6-dideoxygalactose transaminase
MIKIPLSDFGERYTELREIAGETDYGCESAAKALEVETAAYCGTRYAVVVGRLCLEAWGIGPGDEVITAAYGYAAAVRAIVQTGATLVFVDIDASLNIDPACAERAVTKRTRAIIPLHLFGQPAQTDKIMSIAGCYNLRVIEDARQAAGSSYKGRRTGGLCHAGYLSLVPGVNMIATDDGELAARLRKTGSADEVRCAAARIMLKRLDGRVEAMRAAAACYDYLLAGSGLRLPVSANGAKHAYRRYTVCHPSRGFIAGEMRRRGIGCGICYPVPLYRRRADQQTLPAAERAARECFAIPLYPALTDAQKAYTAAQLGDILRTSAAL